MRNVLLFTIASTVAAKSVDILFSVPLDLASRFSGSCLRSFEIFNNSDYPTKSIQVFAARARIRRLTRILLSPQNKITSQISYFTRRFILIHKAAVWAPQSSPWELLLYYSSCGSCYHLLKKSKRIAEKQLRKRSRKVGKQVAALEVQPVTIMIISSTDIPRKRRQSERFAE